ncbi:MAG: rhomboid family intramembrane serine protease [Planctomycetota bacterium]|nr:rhomboid family intramembrane serine protease [Planctomycetota bacterium]
MIPIRDSEPSGITPYVTIALVVINVLVMLIQLGSGLEQSFDYGLRPAYLVGYLEGEPRISTNNPRWEDLNDFSINNVMDIKPDRTIEVDLTFDNSVLPLLLSMFLHGGILHLLGNMWFLWIFGDNIEGRLGHVRYLLFYLLCGVAAGLAHTILTPDSTTPTVGASGAVAGALGAYWLCFPHSRVTLFYWFYLLFGTFELRASWFLGLWVGLDLVRGLTASGGMVAVWAHVGGFVAGLGLVILLTPPGRETRPTRFRIIR